MLSDRFCLFLLQGCKPVEQLWDAMLGRCTRRKKVNPLHSSMFTVSSHTERCLGRKAPAWSPHLGTKGWEEGSAGIRVDRWLFSIDRLSTSDLLTDPKVSVNKLTLLLAGCHHHKKTHDSRFLQGLIGFSSISHYISVHLYQATPPCKGFQLKPPSIIAHGRIFLWRKKTVLKD